MLGYFFKSFTFLTVRVREKLKVVSTVSSSRGFALGKARHWLECNTCVGRALPACRRRWYLTFLQLRSMLVAGLVFPSVPPWGPCLGLESGDSRAAPCPSGETPCRSERRRYGAGVDTNTAHVHGVSAGSQQVVPELMNPVMAVGAHQVETQKGATVRHQSREGWARGGDSGSFIKPPAPLGLSLRLCIV